MPFLLQATSYGSAPLRTSTVSPFGLMQSEWMGVLSSGHYIQKDSTALPSRHGSGLQQCPTRG